MRVALPCLPWRLVGPGTQLLTRTGEAERSVLGTYWPVEHDPVPAFSKTPPGQDTLYLQARSCTGTRGWAAVAAWDEPRPVAYSDWR